MSVYVLIAIVKKELQLDTSLYTLLQILSITLFEKIPIDQTLADSKHNTGLLMACNQLNLFPS